jgi:ubiquinone biosynthesis protein COQ9
MDDLEFDKALITSAFHIAATQGWCHVSVFAAAKAAELSPDLARVRFPSRASILLHLGSLADQAVLSVPADDPTVRERLFDLLMRRYDAMLPYRDGIKALLTALPADPATAVLLAAATRRSMGWMLEAGGVPVAGVLGHLKRDGLIAIWTYTIRVFVNDASPDLSATMAALDRALDRAGQIAALFEPKISTPPA